MKITKIDLIRLPVVQAAGMRPVVCRIHTDEGIHGLGEIGVAIVTGATAAVEMMRDYAPLLLGRDPLQTEVLWETMHKKTFWGIGSGGVIMSAMSAIDTALWDIKARAFGVPLYQLLGGKFRDKLHAYASQIQFGWGVREMTPQYLPEQYAEMARRAVEDGYDTIKANIIHRHADGTPVAPEDARGLLPNAFLRTVEARLAAMRDAVGSDVDIILENHAATDAVSAVQIGRIGERYGVCLMEEPANPLEPDAYRRIAEQISIPLATGERNYSRWGFKPLLETGAIALIQPDIGNCGGVSECRKICDMAALYSAGFQAHVCSSPISVAVGIQMEAAAASFRIHEHHMVNTTPEVTAMGVYDYQPIQGYLPVPDLPGIGQELSEQALRESEIITISS